MRHSRIISILKKYFERLKATKKIKLSFVTSGRDSGRESTSIDERNRPWSRALLDAYFPGTG